MEIVDLTDRKIEPQIPCAGKALSELLKIGNFPLTEAESKIIAQVRKLSEAGLATFGSLMTRRWPYFHKVESEIFYELLSCDLVSTTDRLQGMVIDPNLLDPEISQKFRVPVKGGLSGLDVALDSLDAEELRSLGQSAGQKVIGNKMKIKENIKTAYNGKQQNLFGACNDEEKLCKVVSNWAMNKNFVLVKNSVLKIFACISFALDCQAEDAWKQKIPTVLIQSYVRNFQFPLLHTSGSSASVVERRFEEKYETREKLELHRVLDFVGNACEKFDASVLEAAEAIEAKLKELIESEISEYKNLPAWRQQEHTMRKMASVLWHSVAVLERRKEFSKALDRLLVLIDNPCLGSESRRVKWLVRALVNCGHLKMNETAKEVKKKADSMTLNEAGNFEVAKHFQRFVDKKDAVAVMKGIEVNEETVVIAGAKQRDYGWVETAAYEHAYAETWPNFLHCEGSVLLRIFGLVMFDALYGPKTPWVFRSPLQQMPSDLSENEEGISGMTNVLVKISMMTSEDLEVFIKDLIDRVGTYRTIGFNPDFDAQLPEISRCIGPTTLCVCFERIISDVYHWSGGLPDLLLWNPETSKAKFVEVKGPGDSLSARQALWLRTIASSGADACVLYVTDHPKDESTDGNNSSKRKKKQ